MSPFYSNNSISHYFGMPRQCGKASTVEYIAKILGGTSNEVNRAAII